MESVNCIFDIPQKIHGVLPLMDIVNIAKFMTIIITSKFHASNGEKESWLECIRDKNDKFGDAFFSSIHENALVLFLGFLCVCVINYFEIGIK